MKYILIFIFIQIFSNNLFGKTDKYDFLKSDNLSNNTQYFKNSTSPHFEKIIFSSGNIFKGEIKDGKYNGPGVFIWSDGRKYEGIFEDGKKHGHGKWSSNNGEYFVGEWKNGKKNGHGIFTYPDGSKYIGKWENGRKNGYGIEF